MSGEETGVARESFKPAGLYLALSEPVGTGPWTSTETTGGPGAASWLMGTGWDEVQDMGALPVSFPVDCAKTNCRESLVLSGCRTNVNKTETVSRCSMVLCVDEDMLCSAS